MDKQNEKFVIIGYKAFDSNFMAMNGIRGDEGIFLPHIDDAIKAGAVDGRGYHMCYNFEDTFRYVKNPILCAVTGFGTIKEYSDEFNGYYDIYACSDMYIERVIPRREILEMAAFLNEDRLYRLIQTYKMTDEEIDRLNELNVKTKSKFIQCTINYYHKGNKNSYYE